MGSYRGVFRHISLMKKDASLGWLWGKWMGGGPMGGRWTDGGGDSDSSVKRQEEREDGTRDNEMRTESSCVLEKTQQA